MIVTILAVIGAFWLCVIAIVLLAGAKEKIKWSLQSATKRRVSDLYDRVRVIEESMAKRRRK